MPDAVPARFQRTHASAPDDLPNVVEAAIAAKTDEPASASLQKAYQSLVGALLYCSTQARPDCAFAVGMLCRAMGCPTPALLDATHRVLAYLHHHRDVGLRYALCPDPCTAIAIPTGPPVTRRQDGSSFTAAPPFPGPPRSRPRPSPCRRAKRRLLQRRRPPKRPFTCGLFSTS
eukprot:607083-Pleurochrysis_carterae.AAC.1